MLVLHSRSGTINDLSRDNEQNAAGSRGLRINGAVFKFKAQAARILGKAFQGIDRVGRRRRLTIRSRAKDALRGLVKLDNLLRRIAGQDLVVLLDKASADHQRRGTAVVGFGRRRVAAAAARTRGARPRRTVAAAGGHGSNAGTYGLLLVIQGNASARAAARVSPVWSSPCVSDSEGGALE